MRWELDPDFALQTRVTFGPAGIAFWTLACAAAMAAALLMPHTRQVGLLLLVPGFALLFGALPYSAVQVLALERDGRFDQHRLAGRQPLAMGTAVLTGSSWPIFMTAAVLLVCATTLGAAVRLLDATAVLAAGISFALVLLVLPGGRMETWLLRAGVTLVGLAAAAVTQLEVHEARIFPPYASGLAVAAAVAIAALLPGTMRRLHRPRHSSGRMPVTSVRPLIDLRTTRWPELSRAGAHLFGVAALAAAAALGVIATDIYLHHITPFLFLAGLLSLAAGLFVSDRTSTDAPRLRAACTLIVAVAAGATEFRAVTATGSSYTLWTSWSQWSEFQHLFPVEIVFPVTAALYGAAGFLTGWLLHNLYGETPSRSRFVRLLALVMGLFVVPAILSVPGVERLARRVTLANGWSVYLAVDFGALAVLLAVVAVLMAAEWRRFGTSRLAGRR
jgi:hypothetical protein